MKPILTYFRLGTTLSAAGDVNGDGHNDILASANMPFPQNDRALVFLLSPDDDADGKMNVYDDCDDLNPPKWYSDLDLDGYGDPSSEIAACLAPPGYIANGTDNCPTVYNPDQNDVCPCHGDPQCDGVPNVQDVVQTVNVAFRGSAPVFDPACPRERTDVNCDGNSTVQDVVKVVNVAFRGASPATEFCDPCGP